VHDASSAEARFWQLYDASLPHVYGFLLRRCDKQTAEDLTQEVYVDLVRRVRRGDEPSGFTTGWLITVARSRLIDHMRAQHRRERKLSMAWSAAEPGERQGIIVDDTAFEDMGASTERALSELAEAERCALVLHHLDGMSVADVADAIGRSTRATESLLARTCRDDDPGDRGDDRAAACRDDEPGNDRGDERTACCDDHSGAHNHVRRGDCRGVPRRHSVPPVLRRGGRQRLDGLARG
jgi:RNA polymerase sigma-70 factor (ECF subfamily)